MQRTVLLARACANGTVFHVKNFFEFPQLFPQLIIEGWFKVMDEVKEMVKKAALVLPGFRYVGWDVCLTPDGPAIVEGNNYPAYDFPQLPDEDKPRIGLIPKIESFGIKVRK